MTAPIEVDGLSRWYGTTKALDDFTLEAGVGLVDGLVGFLQSSL